MITDGSVVGGNQLSSRYSQKPCVKGTMYTVIEQDIKYPLVASSCTWVFTCPHTKVHNTPPHTPPHHIYTHTQIDSMIDILKDKISKTM